MIKLIQSGEPFKINEASMNKKLGINQVKIWRHRAWIVYKYLLKDIINILGAILLVIIGILSLFVPSIIINNYMGWLMPLHGGAIIVTLSNVFISGAIIVNLPNIIQAFKYVAAEWNP